jgi:phosphoglycerate kinase
MLPTIENLSVRGKRVLVRVDYNVPMQNGVITDATRIQKSAPTIQYLIQTGAKVILLSHLGRPDGKPNPAYSLRPLLHSISQALGHIPIGFIDDCIGPKAAQAIEQMPQGGVLLCENLRFYPGEEANDPAFTDALAALGDVYVNDAFSAAHRAHASTAGLAKKLPSAMGKLLAAEITALQNTLEKPQSPAWAIIGGAKISTKVAVLENLLQKLDGLIIGGGMANTFLAAQGLALGKSLVDTPSLAVAKSILAAAQKSGKEILLPSDAVTASALAAGVETQIVPVTAIPPEQMILDIGPMTVLAIAKKLAQAKTVLWNGPLGVFETKPFDAGTMAVAKTIADLTRQGKILSVAGGGDTVAALEQAGIIEDLSYVSTAGGAFLEWLEGKELPGISALRRAA